jgi:hypothetical protein
MYGLKRRGLETGPSLTGYRACPRPYQATGHSAGFFQCECLSPVARA